jgi:uncharacterized protein (DUF924 family)
MHDRDAIIQFWLGELDANGRADAEHSRRWWTKDAAFDRELEDRFGADVADALDGSREDWRDDPRGTLAYVILLDQLTRNIFRGTARAFAGDPQAFAATEAALARGFDRQLATDERYFLYMPLMHREDLAAQDRSVELFTAMAGASAGAADFARRHRDVIVRFGRFPHRNGPLGRTSTPAELEYLAQPGAGF